MFEKEAEERARKLKESQTLGIYDNDEDYERDRGWNEGEVAGYEDGFQDGAEFGYNKANEWHYPSKGELPKEDTAEKETLYLLWFGLDDSDYLTGVFSHGRFWCFDCGWFETNKVIAWKEIVLPELPKESE